MSSDLDHLLQAYLDGTLSPARRAAVERRLSDPKVAKRLERQRSLIAALGAAAPLPRPEQSRRMWAAIQAQVQAQSPVPAKQPWTAFFTRPWLNLPVGLGLAGAAALAVFVLMNGPGQPQAPAPLAQASAPAAPAAVPAPAASAEDLAERLQARAALNHGADGIEARRREGAPRPAEAVAAKAKAVAAPSVRDERAPTEVERALAENPVDDLIDRFLAARPSAMRPELASAGMGRRAMAPAAALSAGSGLPAGQAFDSAAKLAVQGGPDSNGFWDWRPAALALNQRRWDQAQAELKAAEGHASEAAERSFAASALSLLSGAGQPLQGAVPPLPPTGSLRVLESGRWQLQVDDRLARFGQGVVVRLPGYRVEADSMLLDMTFDRGSFAPGTHFTRVSGETPAKVLNAAGQPVDAVDFLAPAGAVYNVQDHEIRLR